MNTIMETAGRNLMKENFLTGAETEIALLIVQGYTPKEIALLRSRSIETVRTQIKMAKEKLCVNRASKIAELVFNHAQKMAA